MQILHPNAESHVFCGGKYSQTTMARLIYDSVRVELEAALEEEDRNNERDYVELAESYTYLTSASDGLTRASSAATERTGGAEWNEE